MVTGIPRLLQPREVSIKPHSLVRLRFLGGKSAAIICGEDSLRKSGGLEKIETYLQSAKMKATVIDGIADGTAEHRLQDVAESLREHGPDWIIACGGGSVLDTAKLAWSLYEHPGLKILDLIRPFSVPGLRSKARFIAIPTTSGTGSEASIVATTNIRTTTEDGTAERKVPIVSDEFLPDLVILDPSLTLQLPAELTAYTAQDAFTHAVESYCSTIHNSLSDGYATQAARMIVEHLPIAISEPDDLRAREMLQYAAMLAGTAQNMTSVGASHALAHAIGVEGRLAHGVANAIFLPSVLRYNAQTSPRPLQFANLVGFHTVDELADWVSTTTESAGVPTRWSQALNTDLTVDPERIVGLALGDVCLRTNPRRLAAPELMTILDNTR